MGETVEIRSVLRLDDHSKEVVEKAKEGFEHLHEKVAEVGHEMAGFFKQSLAMAAGFQIDHGIESIKELGEEVFHAAMGLTEENKALASSIAVGDRAGRSYEEITKQAGELHEELEAMGITAGVSTSAIMEAFGTIQSRSSRSVEQTKELTEQMVMASKAVPGGMNAMAESFRDLETGIFRPKNALVQLMRMTGVVTGESKTVGKNLQKMFLAGQGDKVLELAEQAIGRMAEKTKSMPLTFAQAAESLKAMRENVFETAGTPILNALKEPLVRLQRYFLDNRDAVSHWAEDVGHKVGDWIKVAAEKVQNGFEYLKTHADEIQRAIETAVNTAKAVVSWIIDHREMIAIAFGAKVLAPKIGSAIEAGKEIFGLGKGVVGAGAPMLGVTGGMASFGLAVASFAVAVGAWTVATDQWSKLMAETGGGKSDAQMNEEARQARMQDMAGDVSGGLAKEFDGLRAKFVEQADAMGMTSEAAGVYADSLWNQHMALRQTADQIDNAAAMAGGDQDSEAAKMWVELYDKAVTSHNQAIMAYAANVLGGSENLFNAFLASKQNVEEGFDQLAELVGKKSEDFAKVIKTLNEDKGKLPDKMTVNFNGGQTMHIKQDFRDQDPDRIVVAFRKDLARKAIARVESRFGTPFGI